MKTSQRLVTYSDNLRALELEIKANQTGITQLRELLTNATIVLSPVGCSSGSPSDKLGNLISKIDEIQQQISKDNNRMIYLRDEMNRLINVIEYNHKLAYTLRMRCIHDKSWREIGYELGYSDRHAQRLYKAGLEELDRATSNICI